MGNYSVRFWGTAYVVVIAALASVADLSLTPLLTIGAVAGLFYLFYRFMRRIEAQENEGDNDARLGEQAKQRGTRP
jgi:hypothetical protein